MPDKAPVGKRCGAYKQGWISGSHPTSIDQTVDVKICIQSGSLTCIFSESAQITHCGSFFVYKLPDVPGPCSTRYCAISGIFLYILMIPIFLDIYLFDEIDHIKSKYHVCYVKTLSIRTFFSQLAVKDWFYQYILE